jgi:prepilin-type N-terminal cleavage/methylation domain-containing protein
MKKQQNNKSGFTIIEIMFVLAIVSLMMVILFIGVGQLQVNKRDHERKSYVSKAIVAEEEYLRNNSRFPACDSGAIVCSSAITDDASRFISSYLPEGEDPTTGKTYATTATTTGSNSNGAFVKTTSNSVFYFYDAGSVNHNMKPNTGQIFIAVGHYCLGDGPSQAGDGPLSGPDTDFSRIVVLIGLEHGKYYCVDNNGT